MKTLPDNGRARLTEYDVRTIDENGDVIDVASYDTRREAQRAFDRETGTAVLERHRMLYDVVDGYADLLESDYDTIATKGDTTALKAGHWI